MKDHEGKSTKEDVKPQNPFKRIFNNSQRNPGTPTLQCLLLEAHASPSLSQKFPHLSQVSRERGLLKAFYLGGYLQAPYLSQPTSREVNSLHGHKVSARSQHQPRDL